jgi:D-alanyl-D-alanine carboxypeptidase
VGYADLGTHSLAHAGYLYGIGSITKMFVACVIEQLVDEGRLDINSTPSAILGDVVAGIPNADRATIRQLLNHTSGIPTWEFDADWIRRGRGADIALDHTWGKTETLEYIRGSRHPATNEPGAAYNYSNSNYTILGLVVEKVTGGDVLEAIRARILAPLGLRDIRLEGFEPVDRARLPARYQFATDEFVRTAGLHESFRRVSKQLVDVSRTNLSTEWTAGGIVATARDMAVFATALRDGAIVGPAGLKRMLDFRPTGDPDEQIADGMFRDRYGHDEMIGYTGNVLGFGASVGWLEGDDVVLVLMTNVGAMHAGDAAYYPEKLLKETRVIRLARQLAHELAPRMLDRR